MPAAPSPAARFAEKAGWGAAISLLVALFPIPAVEATEPVDFLREIRPILVQNCLGCHGGVKRKAGLSFVSAAEALAPARSGKRPIVPGHAEESELFHRITSDDPDERMPPGTDPLKREQVEFIRRWIAEGAAWPEHWSFRPVQTPALPEVNNRSWPRNAIDYFVLARLESERIAPSPQASPHTLVRRLYLDLLGLLPEPEDVQTALADLADSSAGYERVVDRLLASPHFGERWGRHWLDLARYADTDGYEVDGDRPNAWHWRDWVIQSINDDLPFDRFTVEQLAGDLLDKAGFTQRLATAFHRQTLINKEGGIDQEEYRMYAVMDRVSTTATVWLGLTMSCAQCHDHPYDAVTQREYFQWVALFNNADETQLRLARPGDEKYQAEKAAHQEALKKLRAMLNDAEGKTRETIGKQLQDLEKKAPKDPAIMLDVLAERAEPRTTYLWERGDFLRPIKDEAIKPGALASLQPFQPRGSQGDRLDLARWLVDPMNPLTSRVTVNHIWIHLFGNGLVRTPDDFGASGEPPTHAELLDWLAAEFVRLNWSRKALIKLIVTSSAYQQSSVHRPELAQVDPENWLWHRQNRYRVGAETVRDLHLGAGGLLSGKIGGPGVFPPFPQELTKVDFRSDLKWIVSEGEDRYRRGMYTYFKRTLPDPNLTTFDCPDASATAVQRSISNTPLQALATLNNEVFVEAAQALALRTMKVLPVHERLNWTFQACLGRPPSSREESLLMELFEENKEWYERHPKEAALMAGRSLADGANAAEAAAWTAAASIILNLDEFITRE
jgi:hypothetical protein